MLSKFRSVPSICNGLLVHRFINTNPLCTMLHHQDSPQSPELPPWVKFSDTPSSPDTNDDFVIPSLAPWVDAHVFNPHPTKPINQSSMLNNEDGVEAITTLLKKQPYLSFDQVAQALDAHGFQVSAALVQQILKRFSNDLIPVFGFFKWAKSQTGYVHSPELFNCMVDILGKLKRFDLMWDLVKEMAKLDSGYLTLGTMVKVMRRLSKNRKHEEAIEAFRGLEDFGVDKDTKALNLLMDALVKGDSIEHAQNVFLEFKTSISLNSYSFNILIHGWCKVGNFDMARKTMENMKEHGFNPDVFSYTSLIEAHCRDKDFRKVYQVLEEMKGNGCNPNAVTYTTVMLALGKAGQLSEAMELYMKMSSDGIVADAPVYSALIFSLGKAGRLKDACDVFDDMPKQGVVRDVVTYNTMISIACAHSKEETALRLLKEMGEVSCKPKLETYHPLLKMCCKKKRMKVLKFLLAHMFQNDLSPDVGTYCILVHGVCKSGKLDVACSFFEDMVLQGLTPKDSTVKLLVGELESKGMLKEKEHVENLMARVTHKQNAGLV
ncbi:hypothetical protein RIF29_37626 [Crotalaria pallida]|uniref:PROP1-like PPR domain-containing protein n=1 Tax=Crotalaria pallida TaxID=3830 RepID=A0AAN9ECW0_CROPI